MRIEELTHLIWPDGCWIFDMMVVEGKVCNRFAESRVGSASLIRKILLH